ncbi:MAG TPA: copper ion binding protein, partial [Planococcus sp. (in: firmicutes)]|nr:copper ion binding protein [Planococcus sp. (in: firmicutes)]
MSESKHSTLGITGMTCAACSSRIEKVLNKMDGVEAQVNLSTEKATVDYDPEAVSYDDIVSKVEKLGYGVQTETVDFDILGMTCAACSTRIEKVLNKQGGVKHATVNLATETASIEYDPGLVTEQDFIDKIRNLGYDAKAKADNEEKKSGKEKQLRKMQTKLVISALLTAPLLLTMLVHLFGMNLPMIFMNPWFQMALATPVQFIIGWQFYVGAYKNLRNGAANMDVLIALGTSAAYFYSVYEGYLTIGNPGYMPHLYFETSAIIITLVLFGKYLETSAKSRTTMAISKLLNLQAKQARILRDGEEVMVP